MAPQHRVFAGLIAERRAKIAGERQVGGGSQAQVGQRYRRLDDVSLRLFVGLHLDLDVVEHLHALDHVALLDCAGKILPLGLLRSHGPVEHGDGLPAVAADREPQVAEHRLRPLAVGLRIGAELEVDGIAAAKHLGRITGTVDPRRGVVHRPAEVEVGVVVGDRRLHAVGRRLLKRERLLLVKILS